MWHALWPDTFTCTCTAVANKVEVCHSKDLLAKGWGGGGGGGGGGRKVGAQNSVP